MHPRRPVFGLRRVVFYAFFCYFVGKKLQNHERMKQKTHYSEALAYLRDYCLRHGRLMHFSAGDDTTSGDDSGETSGEVTPVKPE